MSWLLAAILVTGPAPSPANPSAPELDDAGPPPADPPADPPAGPPAEPPAEDDAPIPMPTAPTRRAPTPTAPVPAPTQPGQPKRATLPASPKPAGDEVIPQPVQPKPVSPKPIAPKPVKPDQGESTGPRRAGRQARSIHPAQSADGAPTYPAKCFQRGARCQTVAATGIALGIVGAGTLAGGLALAIPPPRPIPQDPSYLRSYRGLGGSLVAVGTGLLVTGVVLAVVSVVRHRRDTPTSFDQARLRHHRRGLFAWQ